jgi:hypothetical protein
VKRLVALAALAAGFGGCGGGEDLTCVVLSDPENCWAAAALTARECLPPGDQAQMGLMSTDRTSCLFANGTRIVFDTPLPMNNDGLENLAFTIQRGTMDCARFVDTFGNRMELTTEAGTVVSELHPGGEFHLHCPGGPDYESSFDLLFTCDAFTAPTDGFMVTATSVQFTLVSVNTTSTLYTCNLP